MIMYFKVTKLLERYLGFHWVKSLIQADVLPSQYRPSTSPVPFLEEVSKNKVKIIYLFIL
jgi:hypothetical protein